MIRLPRALEVGPRAGLALSLLVHAAAACAQSLHAGPEVSDCASALRAGPTSCQDPERRPGEHPPPSPAASGNPPGARLAHGGELEERVDRYLADYGKPPREAIRALLDPSEANVRAWLMHEVETLARARQLAARFARMRATPEPSAPQQAGPADSVQP